MGDASLRAVELLLTRDVSAIRTGRVRIAGIAREAPLQTKVALECINPDQGDPTLLVDRLEWETARRQLGDRELAAIWFTPEAPERFVVAALALSAFGIYRNDAQHEMDVIVPADELSAAVGLDGVNVRLAAELTGWGIALRTHERPTLPPQPPAIDHAHLAAMRQEHAKLMELETTLLERVQISDIELVMANGVVTLLGTVSTDEEREEAARIVLVSGLASELDNGLEVRAS